MFKLLKKDQEIIETNNQYLQNQLILEKKRYDE